jgi:hypothetical protein
MVLFDYGTPQPCLQRQRHLQDSKRKRVPTVAREEKVTESEVCWTRMTIPANVAAASSIDGDSFKDDTSVMMGDSGVQIHDLVARRRDATVIDIKTSATVLHSSPQGKGDSRTRTGRLVCTLTAHTGSSVTRRMRHNSELRLRGIIKF